MLDYRKSDRDRLCSINHVLMLIIRILHYETARFLHDITTEPEIGQDSGRILNLLARYTYSAFAMQAFGMDVCEAKSYRVLDGDLTCSQSDTSGG